MTKEDLLKNEQNRQKLILAVLDGWSLTPHSLNCFFHKNSDPFFSSLINNFRSIPIAKKTHHHPQKTFLSGKEIFNHQYLIQDIRQPNNFWQNQKMIQISDSLKRSNGRLWFLNYDPDEYFIKLLECSRANGISKVGVYTQNLPENNSEWLRNVPDLIITTMVDHRQFIIEPEDVLIYFCDLSEIDQYNYIVNRQRHSPLRTYALTDENEYGLIDIIYENKLWPNIQNVLSEKGLSVSYHTIDPANKLKFDRQADVAFITLTPDFFDFDLPIRILNRRREYLVNILQNLLLETNHRILLTSRFGKPSSQSDNFELLPFIIIDPLIEPLTNINSPLEQYLSTQHTLADVAPTVLELLDISQPTEMSGRSMLKDLYPEQYIGDHSALSMRHPSPTPRSMFE